MFSLKPLAGVNCSVNVSFSPSVTTNDPKGQSVRWKSILLKLFIHRANRVWLMYDELLSLTPAATMDLPLPIPFSLINDSSSHLWWFATRIGSFKLHLNFILKEKCDWVTFKRIESELGIILFHGFSYFTRLHWPQLDLIISNPKMIHYRSTGLGCPVRCFQSLSSLL